MTHLDDAVLLSHLDGEPLGARTHEVEEHLSGCDECRAKLDEIRETLSYVADALTRADIAVPRPRRPAFPRLPVAVAVALAAVLSITPVRAWVVARARQVLNADGAGELVSVDMPRDPADLDIAAGSVSFVPAGAVFRLKLTSRQVGGSLKVEFAQGESASMSIAGADGEGDLVVLPDGGRIVNRPTSTATYTVVLPATVSRIVIIVADNHFAVLERSTERSTWSIPLSEANPASLQGE